MSEFYTVRLNTLVQVGNYANIDEAEIVKVLTGKDAVIVTQELNAEFEQGLLACYEDNGEFYIQNENSERVCTLTVHIDQLSYPDVYIDSTSSIDVKLSETDYEATINDVMLSRINLTDTLKRDVNNTIENFIFRTNEKNK